MSKYRRNPGNNLGSQAQGLGQGAFSKLLYRVAVKASYKPTPINPKDIPKKPRIPSMQGRCESHIPDSLVKQILFMLDLGIPARIIAHHWGISQHTITQWQTGLNRKHILRSYENS